MNTNLLDIKFARIGARLKVPDKPSRRTRTAGVISLDVKADRKGEFFEIVRQPGAEAEIDVPEKLIHARAHELLEQTLEALARQGISKEAYLQITGKDEEAMAHEAEPEAEAILKREAVLAAVIEAEGIEPSDEELLEAIRPIAERDGSKPEKVLERLRSRGRLGPLS